MTPTEEPLKLPAIRVNKRGEARISHGHRWIFSSEVESADPAAASSDEVAVFSPDKEFLGCATYNHHALIRARVYTRRSEQLTDDLIRERLRDAHARRLQLFPGRDTYRLVFSESDGLPGLVIDKYGDILSVQILTQFMETRAERLYAMLREIFNPSAIVERADAQARANESLPERRQLIHGSIPEGFHVSLNGMKVRVNPLEGQKTGLFLDQVDNWRLIEPFAAGANVLDLFCNAGGFALHAARAGAESVKAVDSSDLALSEVLFNAELNGLKNIRAKKSDAFLYIRARPEPFNVIVCDPPAFARSSKQAAQAMRGYRELNRHCLKTLAPGGILITASCSAAVSPAQFDDVLAQASKDAGRGIRLLPGGGQPADHAPLIGMAESHYLKVRVVQAVD